jgi:hypothetical protein
VTTFLAGYAAGRSGGSPGEIRRLAALASRRAQEWAIQEQARQERAR